MERAAGTDAKVKDRRGILRGLAGAGLALVAGSALTAPAAAQGRDITHPVVGSWIVSVTMEGKTTLNMPNLATFGGGGSVIVSAPPLFEGTPGTPAREAFSAGQGAWRSTSPNAAELRFVFLLSKPDGTLDGISTVHGTVSVKDDSYTGAFTLEVADRAGKVSRSVKGQWRGARIPATGTAPVVVPPAP